MTLREKIRVEYERMRKMRDLTEPQQARLALLKEALSNTGDTQRERLARRAS